MATRISIPMGRAASDLGIAKLLEQGHRAGNVRRSVARTRGESTTTAESRRKNIGTWRDQINRATSTDRILPRKRATNLPKDAANLLRKADGYAVEVVGGNRGGECWYAALGCNVEGIVFTCRPIDESCEK